MFPERPVLMEHCQQDKYECDITPTSNAFIDYLDRKTDIVGTVTCVEYDRGEFKSQRKHRDR